MNFYMLVILLVSIALEWQLAEGDSDACLRLKPLYNSFKCRTCKSGKSNYYKCSTFFKNYNPSKCYFNNTQYEVGAILPGTYPNEEGTKSCVFICTTFIYGAYFEIKNVRIQNQLSVLMNVSTVAWSSKMHFISVWLPCTTSLLIGAQWNGVIYKLHPV